MKAIWDAKIDASTTTENDGIILDVQIWMNHISFVLLPPFFTLSLTNTPPFPTADSTQ